LYGVTVSHRIAVKVTESRSPSPRWPWA